MNFTGVLLIIILFIIIILALREFFCWYYKTNEILEGLDSLQKQVEDQGKKIDWIMRYYEALQEKNSSPVVQADVLFKAEKDRE